LADLATLRRAEAAETFVSVEAARRGVRSDAVKAHRERRREAVGDAAGDGDDVRRVCRARKDVVVSSVVGSVFGERCVVGRRTISTVALSASEKKICVV